MKMFKKVQNNVTVSIQKGFTQVKKHPLQALFLAVLLILPGSMFALGTYAVGKRLYQEYSRCPNRNN